MDEDLLRSTDDVDPIRFADDGDPLRFLRAIGPGTPGGLPLPKLVSAEEVRSEARRRASIIFVHYERLHGILDRHELTIQKRWAKKTREQRRKVLLSAWPNMASSHRPDFDAFTKESEQQREAGTKFKEAYMFPHINQEDLLKPKTMPLFLNARGRTTPDAFAMFDYNSSHVGQVTKAIVSPFLNEHTMMFTGRDDPRAYGELQSWDEHEDAFDAMHSGRGMHPGQGLEILRTQERVLKFLVDFAETVLHDISTECLVSNDFPIQPEPTVPSEHDGGFNSLAIMAAEAPYRRPASLNLSRVHSILSARLSAAQDHIWTLREDPGYFADYVGEFKEHRQELLKDTEGQNHPLMKFKREEILWARVIQNMIGEAYLTHEVWAELCAQCVHLQALQDKYAYQITIEKDLPPELLDSFLKFQHYLKQAAKGPLGQLKHGLHASPPLRRFFVREPATNPSSTIIRICSKPGVKFTKPEARLIFLLRVLWEQGHELFLLRMTTVVDELERLLQSEREAKQLITSYIARILSDLAVVTECIRQLDIYQPWAQTFEEALVDRQESIEKEFADNTKPWAHCLKAFKGSEEAKLARLGDPSDRKFHYPVDKKRTRDNTEAMRKAETKLDEFWRVLDLNSRREHNDLEGTAVRRLLAEPRVLERTPAWVEPTKVQPLEKSSEEVEALCKPMSDVYVELERRSEATVDPTTAATVPKAKVKTRGVAKPTSQSTQSNESAVSKPSSNAHSGQETTFAVDNRALKAFKTLFFTPSVSATPGDLPWADFLHAMVAVGFLPEKLYGSVWQFSPTELDVERSIQFHEPHPFGKLSYRVARRYGRRLNRAYGWIGSMFLPAETTPGGRN